MLGGIFDLLGALFDVALTAAGAGSTAAERPYARRRASRVLARAQTGMLVRVDPPLRDQLGRYRPGFVGLYVIVSATDSGISLAEHNGAVVAEWPWHAIRDVGLARDEPVLRVTAKTPTLVHTLELPLIAKSGAAAELADAQAFLDELMTLRDARSGVETPPHTM